MTVISYPIPPYQNLPIEAQFYLPSRFVISAISLGQTTTVTTTANMNFVIGQLVRLLIPVAFGAWQLNKQQGYVVTIPAPNQVVLTINSTNSNAFVSGTSVSQPQIIPIGDISNGVVNANGRTQNITFIPGSFINVSPL